MIMKATVAAGILHGYQGQGSIEIVALGAFYAVDFRRIGEKIPQSFCRLQRQIALEV
jgi:hypothetical protein